MKNKKDKTEKRNLSFKDIEMRSVFDEETKKKYICGIIPYDSKSLPMWGVTEIISRTAFKKTLADNSNVFCLVNHDENKVLGSTDSGTLSLAQSDEGLVCRCEIPDTTYAADLYNLIERGDVRTMSFGFVPVQYTDNYENNTRTVKEAKLIEVSMGVCFPAYPETDSVTYTRGFAKRKIDIGRLNETLDKDELNDNDKLIIKNTIDILSDIAGIEAAENEPETTTHNENSTSAGNNESVLLEIEAELAA